jgi:hypothetical protein
MRRMWGRGVAGAIITISVSVCLMAWAGIVRAQQLLLPSVPLPQSQFQQFTPGTVGSVPPSSLGGASLLPPSGGGIAPASSPGATRSVPSQSLSPAAAVGPQVSLTLIARYGREPSSQIMNGLVWRIFPTRPDASGIFRAIREEKTANPIIALPPGDYVVHVSFGLASAAKQIRLKEATREIFEIAAGGIKFEGRVGDIKIPDSQISFDVYKGSQFDSGDKTLLVQGVLTSDVVVVPEGVYHIVSNYGDTNAVVRSDIRVQAGKLTDVTVNHRAALITLKLVNERGGEALANTGWSVITPGGDVIKESIGAFPRVILAEGDYRAIARNDGHTYERDFKVITGVDGEVEVLVRR